MCVASHTIYLFLPDRLDLVWYPLGPSVSLRMALEWDCPRPESGLSCLTPGSKLRRCTDWPSQRLRWKVAPVWGTAEREPGRTALPCDSASGVTGTGSAFRVVLAGHHSCAGVWSRALGSFLVVCASQPWWIPEWGFLGGRQDILWAGTSSLLLAPPEFSSVFRGSTNIFYQDLLLWDNSGNELVIIVPGQARQLQSTVA